jgi:hypothetical protein
MITISMETYTDGSENGMGICRACGNEAYGVEPDARDYTCEDCGENAVYGLEELLIMGELEIEGE